MSLKYQREAFLCVVPKLCLGPKYEALGENQTHKLMVC